jgi:2-polyprenyl-3-methyl-5-hydroxy-6-metoxy-1,4-benzoquinol methylase
LRNVSFIQSDVTEIPGNKPFDAAVGRFILEFVPDPLATLATVCRLVRPGGILAFHEPCYGPFLLLSTHLPLWSASAFLIHQTLLRSGAHTEITQLLGDPTARRMLRKVNMQDAPPIMTDNEEAVEHAERNRWRCEEIHGRNRFPMVSKESQPALGPVEISRRSFHPTGDGSLFRNAGPLLSSIGC